MNDLKFLINYMMQIGYFEMYPTRNYQWNVINSDNTIEYKVRALLSDGLIQKHLYGDVLSTIDIHADPVEYFEKHIKTMYK